MDKIRGFTNYLISVKILKLKKQTFMSPTDIV